jgi:hypothetical protein
VLEPADVAWLAAAPVALLTAVAVKLLGPPLGRAFLAPGGETFWEGLEVRPEPAEHGMFLVSLAGPPLLALLVVAGARRHLSLPPAALRRLVLAGQLLLVAFAALCFASQYHALLSAAEPLLDDTTRYFTPPTLAIALALPPLALVLLRRPGFAARAAAAVRDTPRKRLAVAALALLFVAVWLLTAVETDGSIAHTATGVQGHILWSMDETFAIVDGHTPLVSFDPQYGQLWPYVVAAAMALLGTSLGIYSVAMVTISGVALMAVYAALRRIVRSSLLALALFAPFVATGFFMKIGPLSDRFGSANLYSLWPVRYAGPYLLAWLLARHVDGAGPRRTWPLFFAAGLVLLNNVEFGSAALAATAVALVCVSPPRSRRAASHAAAAAAGGLAGAVALLSAWTLVRAGSLPHFGLLLEFTRLYAKGGFEMLPMPRIGIFVVLYATFAAALVTGVVRALRGAADDQPALTALLAWSGVFGLIAGGYYVGRSHPQVLMDLFSPWCLSLALLLVVAVRCLAARGWRRPLAHELALGFCWGLAICSLAQTPAPWSQIERLGHTSSIPILKQPRATAFVRRTSGPHEPLAILISLSHRIAYEADRINVSPYSSTESIMTQQQLDKTIALLRRAGGHALYTTSRFTSEEQFRYLQAAGFAVQDQTREGKATIVRLSDIP